MASKHGRWGLLAVGVVALATSGCIGNIRDTTTPRTSTEMLLVSVAAERAIKGFDASALKGKRVFIDDTKFESVDKSYVVSALRDFLAGNDIVLVPKADAKNKKTPDGADIVVEIRNATLGIWTGDFVAGIPQLPVSAQGFPPILLPPLYLFRRLSQQGHAKLQLWLYDAGSREFLGRSNDLWGHSYYNQWWWFGIGPFDGSNDIYPEIEYSKYLESGSGDTDAKKEKHTMRGDKIGKSPVGADK